MATKIGKNKVLVDLDDPNVESTQYESRTTTTNVEHSTVVIEHVDPEQEAFKIKFEEAQLNLNDLEAELRLTREKLDHLQGACESTEGKLSLLKDATFSYQSIVSKHEITFKTITEENQLLKIQLAKMQDLEKELDDEREKNSVLSDRVLVLERVKEHANEEMDQLNLKLDELRKKSDADLQALRDRIREYELTCDNLQKDLDDKEEEIIRLKMKHDSEVNDLNTALKQKHDDYIIHAEKSDTLAAECEILRQDKASGEENLLREIESLKLKYDQIDGEKGTLEREKEEIYRELSGLEERLKDLETLQAERFELKKDNEELRARIEILIKENKDLEEKRAKLLTEIERLEVRLKDFDGLKDDRDDIQQKLRELKRKYDEVLAENSDFRDKINVLDKEIAKLRRELNESSDLKIKLERLQREMRDLEDNDRNQKNKINDLERELRTAKRDKDELASQLKIEKDRAEENAKKVSELKLRIRELEEELRNKDKKSRDLEQDNKRLEEELDALNNTLDKGKAAFDDMEEELEHVKEENDRLKQELEELRAREVVVVDAPVVEAPPPIIDLSEDLEAANNDKKKLEDQLEQMQHKYDSMYSEFTKKIKLFEERYETLKREMVDKEMLISQLKRDEIRYQEEIKDLKKRLDDEDLTSENDVLRKQISKLEEEVQFLTEELKNADDISIGEVAELEKEIKALKAKILELERQAKDDEKEIERLRKRSKGDEDWKTQYNSLKIQFDSLEREKDFIKREKERLHKEYTEVDDELQNMRSKHSRIKKQLDEVNIEINTLRIQVREYERSNRPEVHRNEIAELKRIINDKDEEIEELKNELQGIDGEEWPHKYESLKLKFEEVEGEKDSLHKEKSELQRELRVSAEKVAELEIKLNNRNGEEKRLRDEVRTYRSKISELELRIDRDRKDDQRTIEKLRKRIAELEEEIRRLKKLLKDSDDNNKKQNDLQTEIDELEKENILLTKEVEDKSKKLKEMFERVKELEERPEPKVQVIEQVNVQSAPEGDDYPMLFESIPKETSTFIVDVVNFPEITLGVLLRSKKHGNGRVPLRGRMLSEYEFIVEPLPGTVLVGQPVAVKVDVKETPVLQQPDRIDGISPDMVEVSESTPETLPLLDQPQRSKSPVALVLKASRDVSPSQAQIINLEQPPQEPHTGAFQPVPQKDQVPRGKLVPIRAVIRDSDIVVQKAEPTLMNFEDSDFEDRNFKPVDIGRSKSFHAGDTRRQQPEPEPSYSNGYADDVIYPRELHQRFEEEREVRAVKPSEYDPHSMDYNQNLDDGVKRGRSWKSIEDITPLERKRMSSSSDPRIVQEPVREVRNDVQESAPVKLESTPSKTQPPPIGFVDRPDRYSMDERALHRDGRHPDDRRRHPDDGHRRPDDKRYPGDDNRQRQRPIRRNKEGRRSFDERQMRAARRTKEREEEERRQREGRRDDIGWDRRLMDDRQLPTVQQKPEIAMWL